MSNFNQYNDEDLFNLFSDWYKEVNGFRPGHRSREDIISWMVYESDPAVQEQRRVEESERDADWLDEMDRKFKEEQAQLEAEQEELYQEAKERMFYEMEGHR